MDIQFRRKFYTVDKRPGNHCQLTVHRTMRLDELTSGMSIVKEEITNIRTEFSSIQKLKRSNRQ